MSIGSEKSLQISGSKPSCDRPVMSPRGEPRLQTRCKRRVNSGRATIFLADPGGRMPRTVDGPVERLTARQRGNRGPGNRDPGVFVAPLPAQNENARRSGHVRRPPRSGYLISEPPGVLFVGRRTRALMPSRAGCNNGWYRSIRRVAANKSSRDIGDCVDR